jgi:hypothetical protein
MSLVPSTYLYYRSFTQALACSKPSAVELSAGGDVAPGVICGNVKVTMPVTAAAYSFFFSASAERRGWNGA